MKKTETTIHSNQVLPHTISQLKYGKTIGIIGGGYVGNTIATFYRETDADVKVYDKFKDIDPLPEVLKQDYLFIAVPTFYVQGQGIDLSAMDEAMSNASLGAARAVIIKSTIVPGTTEKYQRLYPGQKIIFNPEFLTERTAMQDFRYPDRQIIGYTQTSYDIAGEIEQLLPLAPFTRIIPATAAEIVKYFNNTWFAVKVIFANQIYDVCQALEIDYDIVQECAAADRRIGRSHLDVLHDGYRGYGGKCLPKDTRAFIKFAQTLGLDLKLLKVIEEINNELTGGVDR